MWQPTKITVLFAALSGLCQCATLEGESALKARSESEATGWRGTKLGKVDPQTIESGRQIAERECASCHAIDRASISPPQGGPPLPDLLFLNDSDRVAYRLIDGIRTGHDDMPLFDFDVRSADALVAYLKSISGPDE